MKTKGGNILNVRKLKGLMAENNHTQSDLSLILNISRTSVNNKLNGKVEFKPSEIVLIAKAYNVDPSIFFQQMFTM